MKNLLLLAALVPACAVDTTSDTSQEIASSAAARICRNDTQAGFYGLSVEGVEFYGYEQEELTAAYNSYWGGVGWTTAATTTTDCSGNLAMSGQLQQFAMYTGSLRVHEPASDTYLSLPLPANGTCLYTSAYTATTWSYPLTSCGGSTGGGGGGGTLGGGGSHLLM